MADPPSGARADASPRASAPASRLNTTAYQRRAHGRGRRTRAAACARGPDWSDTSARVCSSRIDVSGRADVGHDCRRGRADRSAGTTHKTFDECLHHPTDVPSWRRTHTRTLVVASSGDCVGGCSRRGRWQVERCNGTSRVLPNLAPRMVNDRGLEIDIVKLEVAGFAEAQPRDTQEPEQTGVDPRTQLPAFIAARHGSAACRRPRISASEYR